MEKAKIIMVVNQETEVPRCPYCGCIPVVDARINKGSFSPGGEVKGHDARCSDCGLSAPLYVWEAIAKAFPEQIEKDEV